MKDTSDVDLVSKFITTTSPEESIELSYITPKPSLIYIYTHDDLGATTLVMLRRSQVVALITELAAFLAAK